MATTDTEKHFRLSGMLVKGGTKVARALFEKRVEELSPDRKSPWTVQDFLMSKKKEIQQTGISKEKYDVLFPRYGATVVGNWDLSLLCTILTRYCELSTLQCLDIKQIKKVRNELCHANELCIDDVKYKSYSEAIEVVIDRVLQKLNDQSLTKDVTDIIQDMKEGPLSLTEIRETFRTLHLVNDPVRERVDKLDEKSNRMLEQLERIEKKLDDPAAVKIPGVAFYVDFKNLGAEEADHLSDVLVKMFEANIKGNEDLYKQLSSQPDSFECLRKAVQDAYKKFLSNGLIISETKKECVLLKVQCRTITALVKFFRDYAEGRLMQALKNLEEAISMMDGYSCVQIELIIYRDTFLDVLDNTFSAIEESVTENQQVAVHSTDTHSFCMTLSPSDMAHLQLLKSPETHAIFRSSMKAVERALAQQIEGQNLTLESRVGVNEQYTDSSLSIEENSDIVPQDKPLHGRSIMNTVGGFVYELNDIKRLQRFVIIGTEGGSYTVKESELRRENISCIDR